MLRWLNVAIVGWLALSTATPAAAPRRDLCADLGGSLAFGVSSYGDPTSVPVAVTHSGHPDVAGFTNDAAGLGHALVALREHYAPEVRLGWHASNFRVGTHETSRL